MDGNAEVPEPATGTTDEADGTTAGAGGTREDTEEPTAGAPARRRRHWGRWVALVVALVVVAWVAVGVGSVLLAAGSADDGIAAMDGARAATGSVPRLVRSLAAGTDDASDGDGGGSSGDAPTATVEPVRAREASRQLREASGHFADAADRAGSAWLAPARVLPVLGRQLRSVDAMATSAQQATTAAADTLDQLVEQLQGDTGGSAARLDAAQRAAVLLRGLRTRLSDLDLGPTEALFPQVASARSRFASQRAELDDTLEQASVGLDGVVSFLRGPSRYLVVAANNAEMRSGSGMFLAAGELGVRDGTFDLGDVVPTQPLQQAQPATTMDPDVARLWGWTSPDRDMRNVNLTPRFDESARMAADLWQAQGGAPVDGVLAIDVRGLQDLLAVVGPVQVDGPDGPLTVSADNVRRLLLFEQYLRFTEQDLRRDLLGQVVRGVFSAFNERPWSAAALVGALQRSGTGRNLLLWSRDPAQEEAWQALGASGTIAPDSVLLSVASRGGNKLDQFLDVRSSMTWADAPGDPSLRRVQVVVQLSNAAPDRLPRYIEGPYPGTGLQAGEYRGVLNLTIPAGAGNATMTGAELSLSGSDGPARMVGGQVQIPRGASTTVTITFDLPDFWRELTILPSARIPPVAWEVDGVPLPPRKPTRVQLDEGG